MHRTFARGGRTLTFAVGLLPALTGACLGGRGPASEACITYFDVVETCANKAEAKGTAEGDAKAKAWRSKASIHREGFAKQGWGDAAIEEACERSTPPIRSDPDCQ